MAGFTFAGFARTYYLRPLFLSKHLTVFLHIHGAVMTAWFVLFLVQSVFISNRQVQLHRKLGYLGAALAALVVMSGGSATVLAAAREVRGQTSLVHLQLSILALELTQMLLFGFFAGAAILRDKRRDLHKYYLLLGTLCMLPNPEVRLLPFIQSNLVILALWSVLVLIFVVLDALRTGRLHRTFLEGALIANAALYSAYFGSETGAWQRFSSSLLLP